MSFKIYIHTFFNHRSLFGRTILLCLFVLIFASSCNVNKYLAENEYLVEKNTISKNGTSLEKSEIEAFIRQKPNRKILKLFRFNLWLYNQVNQQKMLAYKEKRNLKYDKINEKRSAKNAAKNEKRSAKGKPAKLPKSQLLEKVS